MNADVRVELAGDVHVRTFDGDLVILDLEKGDYFGVNEIGARLWAGLAAGKSPREIASELADEYDVDATTLLDDLVALTGEFLTRGLVRQKADAAR